MEIVLNFIYSMMPFFHILAAILLILKVYLILNFRNFDLGYLLSSYFRFYQKRDLEIANSKNRKKFIVINNYVNYYTYAWVFLCIIIIAAFGTL